MSIGSNQGDRQKYLLNALEALDGIQDCTLDKSSKFFQTAPWGMEDQPPFLNAACGLYCEIPPHSLLMEIQQIESDNARNRSQKWGPRTLDLDIICFGNVQIDTPELTIPHRFFSQRAFVLEPLSEIYPELEINGRTVRQWLQSLDLANPTG